VILFSWILGNTLLIAGFFALTYAFYELMRPVKPAIRNTDELPFISVLVPARNEEGKIGRCLASLLAQDYPNFEIIVIDDRSTDNTAQIIQSYVDADEHKRIKFVHGTDLPSGWIGKCNALAHAVNYAIGEWLVFTDADTYHKTNSIRDSVYYSSKEHADLVSFIPMQELGSFPERLIMPVLLSSFLLGDPFHSVNDPQSKRAYAYGQYIICKRSSYFEIGGHQSVRNEIVEDHALGQLFKDKGYKIEVADGRDVYSVRMYTNLTSLWQGWTKNLYSLIDSRVANLLIILLLINSVALFPFVQLLMVCQMIFNGHTDGITMSLLTMITIEFVLLAFWFDKTSQHHAGIDWRNFFMFPLGSLAVSILYLHAAYLVLSGSQVNWKGRRYVVNTAKTIETSYNHQFENAFDSNVGSEVREVSTIR
jgi:chlorobactene glucosyltransferase